MTSRIQQHKVARVNLWGKMVGALSYDERTELCAFEYSSDWLKTGIEISPIKLPLSDRIFQFPALSRETFKGLPGAFADTLPDDFGNAVIDAWLARIGRDKSSFTVLERLLYTGERGIGALEYAPAIDKGLQEPVKIELESLVSMAQSVLDQRMQIQHDFNVDQPEEALTAIMQVGTSAGGARPKAVIGINQERTEIRSGQVELPKGFEHYILKFDGVVEHSSNRETFGDPQGYGRMEYAYFLMAQAAGLEMSPSELLIDGQRAHFMTKRFDRLGNQKIHYQSLCAMDHADYKQPGQYSYEQLFSLMRLLRFKKAQAMQMYRRMVFNVVARNHDDHTKNFGFLLDRNNQWKLAPAFDVAYSFKPGSPWVNSHQLSINGKRGDFTRKDLLVVADKFRREANTIVDEIIEVVSRWQDFAKDAQVDKAFAQRIASNHRLDL